MLRQNLCVRSNLGHMPTKAVSSADAATVDVVNTFVSCHHRISSSLSAPHLQNRRSEATDSESESCALLHRHRDA